MEIDAVGVLKAIVICYIVIVVTCTESLFIKLQLLIAIFFSLICPITVWFEVSQFCVHFFFYFLTLYVIFSAHLCYNYSSGFAECEKFFPAVFTTKCYLYCFFMSLDLLLSFLVHSAQMSINSCLDAHS